MSGMDVAQIQALLPHRYPFLLVDQIRELEVDRRIVAIKNVTINEPFFQGHFPGRPVMPGVLILEAMAQAVEWYHQRLLTGPDAAQARGYLRSRGYDGDVVRRYKLGWAPDDWDALAKALKLDKQVLVDTGLAFVNKRDRLQDSFRARVLFPIFDARGDAVAIGAGAAVVISSGLMSCRSATRATTTADSVEIGAVAWPDLRANTASSIAELTPTSG